MRKLKSFDHLVGNHVKIHGGKLVATIVEADSTSVILDYDGCLNPEDKRTRVCGRKLVDINDLLKPELIVVNQFKHITPF